MATLRLYIDNGRVNCPRSGDLDIDWCIGCRYLVDIRDDDGHAVLECGAPRPGPFDALNDPRMWTGC